MWPAKKLLTSKSAIRLCQLFISLILVSVVQATRGPNFFDDAFITFRYARNISQGAGFVYNIDQQVLGTTSPLYALILAGIARMTTPDFIPNSAWIIAWIADVLNLWLVFRIVAWIFKDQIIAGLVAVVFLLQPLRLDVAPGGMETSLYMTLLLVMYDRYLLGRRSMFTAVWACLAFLIRPDALVAILPVFADWLFRDYKTTFKAGVVFSALSLPWLLWATAYFGSPVPQSIIAKGASSHQPLGAAAFFLLTFISTGSVGPYLNYLPWIPGILLLILLVFLGGMGLYKTCPAAIVAGSYPVLYFLVMSLINPPLHFAWYYPPLMFGLLLLIVAAFRYLFNARRVLNYLFTACLAVLLIGFPSVLMSLYPNWPLDRSREAGFWNACAAVQETVQPGQVVLTPDIGILGWCLRDATILDSNGLVSPQVTQYDQKISLTFLLAHRPDFIISLDQFMDPELLHSPRFGNLYAQIWEQAVTITGSTQKLRVYQIVP